MQLSPRFWVFCISSAAFQPSLSPQFLLTMIISMWGRLSVSQTCMCLIGNPLQIDCLWYNLRRSLHTCSVLFIVVYLRCIRSCSPATELCAPGCKYLCLVMCPFTPKRVELRFCVRKKAMNSDVVWYRVWFYA